MFDPEAIINQTVEEANDTVLTPIPEGEYQAYIDKFEIRQAKESVVCDVHWKIDNPQLEEELGRELFVKQGIFLDVTEGGALDFSKGKNVQLGRLREALNMNVDGQPWNFGMITGNTAYIRVAHKPNADGTEFFANVKGVSASPSEQE